MNAPISRREFLKASGALIVSAAAGDALAQRSVSAPITVSTSGKPALVPTELDSWVAIAPDGRVTAFFGKMDMGQSLDIAIAQIVADELDVDVAKVDVVMGDTALTCNQGGAWAAPASGWAQSPCAAPRPKRASSSCRRPRRSSACPPSSCASTTAW